MLCHVYATLTHGPIILLIQTHIVSQVKNIYVLSHSANYMQNSFAFDSPLTQQTAIQKQQVHFRKLGWC